MKVFSAILGMDIMERVRVFSTYIHLLVLNNIFVVAGTSNVHSTQKKTFLFKK